jgi:hypothetical protein
VSISTQKSINNHIMPVIKRSNSSVPALFPMRRGQNITAISKDQVDFIHGRVIRPATASQNEKGASHDLLP